jgi:hypothetical protein
VVSVPLQALNLAFCLVPTTDAGIVGNRLVVTLTIDHVNSAMCIEPPTVHIVTAQAIVRRISPGAYVVILVRRDALPNSTPTQYEVARGLLTLP